MAGDGAAIERGTTRRRQGAGAGDGAAIADQHADHVRTGKGKCCAVGEFRLDRIDQVVSSQNDGLCQNIEGDRIQIRTSRECADAAGCEGEDVGRIGSYELRVRILLNAHVAR